MASSLFEKAAARICFFGDHQDYLGLPIIAATIDRYIYMEATPIVEPMLHIDLLDEGKSEKITLQEGDKPLAARDYFRSAIRVLAREGIELRQGYCVKAWGDIPIQAGLSSSSALVVAWIRLLLKMAAPHQQFSPEKIAHWSYTAEVLEFNEPGGLMDQFTIALGGLLYIDTRSGNYQRLEAVWDSIVVVDSGIEKDTLHVLATAKTSALEALAYVKEKQPCFQLEKATPTDYEQTVNILPKQLQPYWYAALHNHYITQEALAELKSPTTDLSRIAHWMNTHQRILQNHIKNTPEAMIDLMELANEQGAKGMKIVGSGGGGCFVVLTTKQKEKQLINALKKAGVKDAFPVNITSPSHA